VKLTDVIQSSMMIGRFLTYIKICVKIKLKLDWLF